MLKQQAMRGLCGALVIMMALPGLLSAEPFAYIANRDSDTVSVIDTATESVVSTITVGSYPHGVAVTPDGKKVFVANRSSASVSVIDTATRAVSAVIGTGALPISIAIDASGAFAYVVTRGDDMLTIIDTATLAIVGSLRISDGPGLIITHPTLPRAYTAHNGAHTGTTLNIIDTQTRAVVNTLQVGSVIVGMALHPDGNSLYLVDEPSRSVIKLNLTSLLTTSSTVVGIDPYGIAVAPSGSAYYVSDIGLNQIHVVDNATNAVLQSIPVGVSPKGLGIHPDGARLYVSNLDEGSVSVIDMASNTVAATIPVGQGPVGTGQIFSPMAALPPAPAGKPNFIVIVTDDMRKDDMAYMPNVQSLLVAQGMKFDQAFVVNGTCCPARAAILRGEYPQNSSVTRVGDGFRKFKSRGKEADTLATRLQNAGYRTGLYGKYFVDYPSAGESTYTPPGWDDWIAMGSVKGFFNYEFVENGVTKLYGDAPEDYATDVLSARVLASIDRVKTDTRPFFFYLTPFAPHDPATPAPRHANLFTDLKAPRPSSYDEANVTDKPKWIQELRRLDAAAKGTIDNTYRNRLRSLQSVDEMVASLVAGLNAKGVLQNTYIIFTSDQGFSMGEHRIREGKGNPYEEAIGIPFVMRGPGVAAGVSSNSLVLHTDIMPTLLDLAALEKPDYIDGRSIQPLLGGAVPSGWRNQFLIDHTDLPLIKVPFLPPSHRAVRTKDYTYVEYPDTGEREFYDLKRDPYQLTNTYSTADANLIKVLSADLATLNACAGSACTAAEDAVNYALTVSLAGAGTVTSSDGSIACGTNCGGVYSSNTLVTLIATPNSGLSFTGWSGACTNVTGNCVVTMNASKSVTANFVEVPRYTLTVTLSGGGLGSVTSTDGLINCGTNCTGSYALGTGVTLTATPQIGSRFSGWSEACTNTTGNCVLTMDAAKTASARFTLSNSILTVSKQGNGTGTVTSTDGLINCGADCSENYPTGTVVTLTAIPSAGSSFSSWDNALCPGTGSCTVMMDVGKTLRPRFTRP